MARIRRHGTAAILYLILSIAGLGLMGCSDSTDAPIAQPDTINPNLEGTFNARSDLSRWRVERSDPVAQPNLSGRRRHSGREQPFATTDRRFQPIGDDSN